LAARPVANPDLDGSDRLAEAEDASTFMLFWERFAGMTFGSLFVQMVRC
jgi:hypothetical protein